MNEFVEALEFRIRCAELELAATFQAYMACLPALTCCPRCHKILGNEHRAFIATMGCLAHD